VIDHHARTFAIAGKGQRHRTEIASATGGIVIAITGRHRLVKLGIEERKAGLRVGARLA
jgi:DNA integrity scanning protein DisA with diadenylate cyclase activity